jgi:acyl-coenzyme A synthetase/AMP-(fatty) acid ligase
MNILLPIRRNAQAFPDRTALVADGTQISYGQLLQLTALAAARLREAGVARGDSVALSIARPGAYLITALAVARLGAVVTPFDVTWPAPLSDLVLTRHQVRTLVRDVGEEWRHPSLAPEKYLAVKDLLAPARADVALKVPEVAMDVGSEPWALMLSSGTTGTRKSIPQSHDRAVLMACLPNTTFPPADLARVLVFASAHLSMSMSVMMQQLMAARTVLLESVRTPEQFFAVVARDRPTHVALSTGNAMRVAAYAARSVPDSRGKCESLRGITISGSAASAALQAQIKEHICPNLEIGYGSTEAGSVSLANSQTLAQRPGSAGLLRPWVEMEAVDEQGRPLPAGQTGALRVRGPLVVAGYLDDPDSNAKAFRDGWYYPGDTGHVDQAGYVTLTGRSDELLNLGGNKIDPILIEAVLDAQPGVRESVVVAVSSEGPRPVLIALVVTDGAFDEQALRHACVEKLGAKYAPTRIRKTESIPRNAGGKVMRQEVAERIAKLGPLSAGSHGEA